MGIFNVAGAAKSSMFLPKANGKKTINVPWHGNTTSTNPNAILTRGVQRGG
jgi:hypothetical protein